MFYTWSSITDAIKKEEEPTPESLRAAAKVLEEKAKELEKPSITGEQQAAIDYANAYSASLVDLDLSGDKYRFVDKYRNFGELDGETYSFTFIGTKYVMHNDYFVKLAVLIDYDNMLETFVVYPKS